MTTCGTAISLVAYEGAFVSLTYLKRLDGSQIAVTRFCRSEHLDPRFQPVEGQARFADAVEKMPCVLAPMERSNSMTPKPSRSIRTTFPAKSTRSTITAFPLVGTST